MLIFLHTSKTMRSPDGGTPRDPVLMAKAQELGRYLQTLSPQQLQDSMKVSADLAAKTHQMLAAWEAAPRSIALDSFVGDIYSGLQASSFTAADRTYADAHLRILSGLYGILSPLDTISPYRLEMGYRLPDSRYRDLYAFWGDSIAKTLPDDDLVVNLAAVEYSKAVTPYVSNRHIIAPKFLTIHPVTGEPTYVVVHAKIARGAYARWLIQERIHEAATLTGFNAIGYSYDSALSTPTSPVFVAKDFQGKGLSMRLN